MKLNVNLLKDQSKKAKEEFRIERRELKQKLVTLEKVATEAKRDLEEHLLTEAEIQARKDKKAAKEAAARAAADRDSDDSD